MTERARRIFGLDLRALAALRIACAALLIASLADRARNFSAFYTDTGILSAASAERGAAFPPWDGVSWLQPFAWAPDPWGSVGLMVLASLAAAFLLVGRRAKAAGFVAWLALTGLDNRNPLVIDAGDDLLRLFLFWGLFLPLAARWSVEARPLAPGSSIRIASVGTAAFLLQLALIYPVSAFFKSYDAWVTNRVALHYALHLEQFVTPFGIATRDYLPTGALSAATWWFELLGSSLLFSPFATERLRYALFLCFAAMHTGIAVTMDLWLFSLVCLAGWLVTLPTGFWNRADRTATRSVAERADFRSSPAGNLAAGFFLGYVVLWNLWSLSPAANDAWFPPSARSLGYQLRLGQLWAMFSPAPPNHSSWLELSAVTLDGKVARLRPDGRRCDVETATPERLLSARWRKFHERVIQTPAALAARYADFLSKRFEAAHGAPAKVTVVWMRRASPAADPSKVVPHLEDARLLASTGLE